tara:strand:- start:717 stop:875 length:159 start_codon:yes stop_codon:yes gene_type:complete
MYQTQQSPDRGQRKSVGGEEESDGNDSLFNIELGDVKTTIVDDANAVMSKTY